jgi:hypothetical protein
MVGAVRGRDGLGNAGSARFRDVDVDHMMPIKPDLPEE